jgi:hypothetical protein
MQRETNMLMTTSKLPPDAATKWLKENDPENFKERRPQRQKRQHLARPARMGSGERDYLFRQESAYLMALPPGSTWMSHASGNGVTVSIPGQAPFWRKLDGTIG